jgi:hypothetical protein
MWIILKFPLKIIYILAYFIIFAINECQLELEFCRINTENAGLAFTVQTKNLVALHTSDVNWKVQCADYSMISVNKHEDSIKFIPVFISRRNIQTSTG